MKYTFLLCFAIISSISLAQTDSFGKIDFGFQGISAGYEAGISDNLVINSGAGIGGGYYVRNTSDGTSAGFHHAIGDPAFNAYAELKLLTNEQKRIDRGKRTSLNSSNYLAYQIKYASGNENQIDNSQSLLNEVHWGFQRRLGEESRFLFNFHLGVGYLMDFDYEENQVVPTVGGKFAFKLF